METENSNQELARITSKNLSEIYKPDNVSRKLAHVATIRDAIKMANEYPSQYPSLAKLKKHHGESKIETIIKLYLVDLCEKVNLKRPLTEKQIDTIAFEVVNTHYMLTIVDVQLIFRKASLGHFGTFYESLDMPKIMKWFNDYFDERCEYFAQENINMASQDKHGNMTPERMTKHFDMLEKKFNKK